MSCDNISITDITITLNVYLLFISDVKTFGSSVATCYTVFAVVITGNVNGTGSIISILTKNEKN